MDKYTLEFTPKDRPIIFNLVYDELLGKWSIWQKDVFAGKDYYTKEITEDSGFSSQKILDDIKYKFVVNNQEILTTFIFCYRRESDDWIVWRRDDLKDKNVLSGFYGFPPA